tara:strand:- start:34 stop:1353 length:1320 start_codon:yes stop_codon:yes gene_type:complete
MSKPMVFDDVDDYIDLGDVAIGGQSSITVSAWIIRTGYSDSSAVRNGCISKDNELECWVRVNSEDVLGMSINNTHYSSDYELPADGWHHVVWTWVGGSPSTIKWYVDGALVDTESGPSAATISNTASTLYFGGRSTSYRLKGNMNEVSMWHNKAFSLAEVQELFNDGVALDATTHSASSDLVGYWRNDGASTWTDRTANSNDGTVAGSPETILLPEGTTSGKDILGFPLTHTNNGWLNLSGAEYVSIPMNDTLRPRTNDYSYECWIRRDGVPATAQYLIYAGTNGVAGRVFIVLLASGKIQVGHFYSPSGECGDIHTGSAVTDGDWHHIVLVGDRVNGKFMIYIDAVLVLRFDYTDKDSGSNVYTSASDFIATSTDPFLIGRHGDGTQLLDGQIDEVRFYKRALSDGITSYPSDSDNLTTALTSGEILQNYQYGEQKHE